MTYCRRIVWLLFCLGAAGTGCGSGSQPAAGVPGADSDLVPPRFAHDSAAAQADRAPRMARDDDWFEDVTGRTGIDFAYRNGRDAGRFYLIESFGGGVGMLDFDRDGDIDLFFTGGGTISTGEPAAIAGLPPGLCRNEGDWRFAAVTVPAGFAEPADYSQGCAVADFDADGFPDLFVCCYGESRLYRNQGDGIYQEVAGLPARGWGTTAAFGDFDRDGFPDLFLARYTEWSPDTDMECSSPEGIRDLCGPTAYPGTTCLFLRNSGDGRFEDWSERAGLKGDVRGLGVVAADLNGDGWVDFYVASDETPKQLYLGGPGLRFIENAAAAGVAVNEWGQPEGSMGVDVADYNGDGLPDIFVTNFENEDGSLYRNLGDGLFMHSTSAAGLAGHARMHVGFGTSLTDFDGDGWPDLFVLNGNPIYRIAQTPFRQIPQLFRNLEGRRFENISDRGGPYFHEAHSGRGNAVGDLDGDGAPDLALVLVNEPVRILRNRHAPGNYFSIELRARHGEPDATGARVTATFAGRRVVRFAVRGTGFFSQSDPRMIFPAAPEATVGEVTVEWPGRGREVFSGLGLRKNQVLVEGRGKAVHEGE